MSCKTDLPKTAKISTKKKKKSVQDGFTLIFATARLRICYDKLSLEYHKTHANLRGKI